MAVRHEGLFTFAHSPEHIALYQHFGFWPRFLTAIMSKPVSQARVRQNFLGTLKSPRTGVKNAYPRAER